MTQGGKKMEEIRKTSCIKRVISMLLAVLMILVSVPISSLTASAGNNPPRYGGDWGRNVINLKRILNGKQNVWKYQNGEEKSDSDGREKDV